MYRQMIHRSNSTIRNKFKIVILLTICLGTLYYIMQKIAGKNVQSLGQQRWIWPPKNPNDVRNDRTGYYDVTLHPIIQTDELKLDWIEKYVFYLENRFKNHTFEGSRLRQLVQMDEMVRLASERPNFMLYPQAIDVKPVFESIRTGEPIRHVPINNPEIWIMETPRLVCKPVFPTDDTSSEQMQQIIYDLVIIFKSCTFCFEERESVRRIYEKQIARRNMPIGIVFIIGQPLFNPTPSFNLSNTVFHTSIKIPKLDEENPIRNEELVLRKLANESQIFGDLIVGSFVDTYFNLTLKQMTAIRWASSFCRGWTKLFLFIDHDKAVDLDRIISFVHKIPQDVRENFAGGELRALQGVIRSNTRSYSHKWSVSEDEIPWKTYPAFAPGPRYLLGSKVVEEVSIASSFTRFFRLEDVFLGFVMQKLDRIFVAHEGFPNRHDQEIKKKLTKQSN